MWIIFLLSLIGVFLLFCIRTKLDTSFFGIIYASTISVVLYLFALFDLLNIGVYIVLGLGVAALFYSLYYILHRREFIFNEKKGRINLYSLCFVFWAIIWLWGITRNVGLSHWDDMSHWYRICKAINYENALPTTPDIAFPSYVPGTAIWIYYITRFTGFSVSKCFFSQSLINILGISCLFSFCKSRDKKWTVLTVLLLGVILCALDVSTYALLVDTVIGIIPISAVCMYIHASQEKPAIVVLCVATLMGFECLIKSSGMLFAVFVCLFPLFFQIYRKKEFTLVFLSNLIIPISLTFSYILRANNVYGEIANTKQGVSMKRYASIFGSKTFADLLKIAKKNLVEYFNIANTEKQVQIIWICIIILIVFGYVIKEFRHKELRYICTCFLMYAVGLFFTYVCSMESYEANEENLAVFYRYIGTLAIFVLGITFVFLIKKCQDMSLGYENTLWIVLILIVLVVKIDLGYIWGEKYYCSEEPYTTYMWDAFAAVVPENQEYTDKTYVVIWDYNQFATDYSVDKITCLVETYFRTKNYATLTLQDVVNESYSDEIRESCAKGDYLVTLGDYSMYDEYLRKLINYDQYKVGLISLTK